MKNERQLTKKYSTKWVPYAAVLISAVILVTGCSLGGAAGTADVQLATRPVKTEVIKSYQISEPIEQVADVMAGTSFDIVPKVSGEVLKVLKKRGEPVEKGEVLFIVDSSVADSAKRKNELAVRNAEESLQQARDSKVNNRSDLQDGVTRAEVAYTNAQEAYNKIRNEFDAGLAVQHQVDQAKQASDDALMSLESAKNKLTSFDHTDSVSSAKTQLESTKLSLEDSIRALQDYSVKAPESGVLTDFNLVTGQSVSAASGAIGQIQKVDPVKIKTELSETNYNMVKGKQELVYYDPDTPDRKGKAKISYLAPIMSATTKTFTLELEIANPDLQLQPGNRYMIQLTTEQEEQVVAVPLLSLIREESDTYVFVLEGDQYHKRMVKLGRINGQFQEVLEGVKEGELLVINGQNTLKDGQQSENRAAPETTPKI
ncbi:RND family efflux transporter, MFP subunit [Paenibacillus sp. UNCCL117]|uniref:efflux RND transporter periplasmic adaptor subunit n=1 Tax=unclassified Paenibacillus TaxID=185978 RepID=UPI0008884D9D|nr:MULTISPECIES: efflux RND transporter periplasmic adaptor subunit [unclassified Paenibacillus]SDD72893.1 RND family efflux transporter, MFP subunit [Paenibacillus sp. cl123]SFW45800.1 RND family efflux transporter, MFP subunit [Paenibacillus sp. UNCCL117]